MKHPRAVLILSIVFAGCARTLVPLERTAIFDKEYAADLLRLCSHQPDQVTGFWTPSTSDLLHVEDSLEAFLSAAKPGSSRAAAEWIYYYRQVAGIVKDGKQMLFISYAWFPDMQGASYVARKKAELQWAGRRYDPHWWRREPIFVYGGAAFFRVIYDPAIRGFVWYDQNGPA